MNILITAGGTSEKIDEVRHLTNHATGTLGYELASFLQKETAIKIYYVYGPKAILPDNINTTFFPIHSVRELEKQMKELLTTVSFDYVIHSMAVSDYELDSISNEELLAKNIAEQIALNKDDIKTEEELKEMIQQILSQPSSSIEVSKKISSKNEKLILVMKKAPKVISQIKKLQPSTRLIGFKLLVDVPESELVSVAQASIKTNRADLILANDLININKDKHEALLVSAKGIIAHFNTKKEIAEGITQLIILNKRKDD